MNETGAFAVHCDKPVYFAVHFLTFFSPNDSNYKIVSLLATVSVCDPHFDDVPLSLLYYVGVPCIHSHAR